MTVSSRRTGHAAELTASPPVDGGFRTPQEAAVNRTLADVVHTLRVQAGITQTELARLIGSTQSAVSRIESGCHTPTLPLLERLSRGLGAPLVLHIAGHAVVFADTDPPAEPVRPDRLHHGIDLDEDDRRSESA